MKNNFILLIFLVIGLSGNSQESEQLQQHFKQIVDSVFAANPEAVGFMVHVEAPDRHIFWSYAAGAADKTSGEPLSPDRPVLVASNTKPYIAATILKLAEKGKIAIDDPIEGLISEKSAKALSAAGYKTNDITLMHLMSHTSGIRDYVDESYFSFITENKRHEWTRDEQIALAASKGLPLAQPGEGFHYADINYVLLTEVIETITQKPFYKSVRSLLNFKQHGLNDTWFVKLEKKPAKTKEPASQYWTKFGWNISDLDPSWDLYGGGGIASTVEDMAHFFQVLFGEKGILSNEMLEKMHADVPSNLTINYCLGIKKIKVSGYTAYNHGGGLGTDVIYIPELNASIAVSTLEATKRPAAMSISAEIAGQMK